MIRIEGLNPVPWTSPDAEIGRRNGKIFAHLVKDGNLVMYQEAVKETLRDELELVFPTSERVALVFYFWRQLYVHNKGRSKEADATNLQKALEDALQGVLYKNDRQVVDVRSIVVSQSITTDPRIVIMVMPPTESRFHENILGLTEAPSSGRIATLKTVNPGQLEYTNEWK